MRKRTCYFFVTEKLENFAYILNEFTLVPRTLFLLMCLTLFDELCYTMSQKVKRGVG